MKKFLHSRDGTSKGAALIIVLAFVVLVTVLGVTYLSRDYHGPATGPIELSMILVPICSPEARSTSR